MLESGVATAADAEFVPDAAPLGASDAGAARTVRAAIVCASAPVSDESAAAFAANVPGGEVVRPDDAAAGAAFDAALSVLDTRTTGFAAARTAALLIIGGDPGCVALAPPEGSLACAAAAAIVRAAVEGFAASAGAAAPCTMSVGGCRLNTPPLFDRAVEAAAEGATASPAAASAAASCPVAPADPTGAVTDFDLALDGGTETAGAAVAVAAGAGVPAVDPAADDAAAGAPAAAGGGGKGDGEELPATGSVPPLASPPAGVCAVVLRLGFAPASFKAWAKSWL
jgi:hypothetical protein